MSTILTSKDLIRSIKRRAFIPKDQSTFTDADFLEIATEEITLGLMEQILEARGNYLVYHIDVPLVADQFEYEIPSRAHGSKLRDASINDASDVDNVLWDLKQVDVEDLSYLNEGSYSGTHFYIENDKVILSESIVADNRNIRMYFYMRPNKLVVNERGGVIASIADGVEVVGAENVNVKIFSFTTLPTHFTTAIDYDITSHVSPNKIVLFSLEPVTINTTLKTVSFRASDITETVAVGDYLTQAEETIVPNLPTEFHPIVAQRAARACLEAMNDDTGFAKASAKLKEMEESVLKIITNRVEGSPKKIKNRDGTLRQGINKTFRKW